jgi:hypothetical protein
MTTTRTPSSTHTTSTHTGRIPSTRSTGQTITPPSPTSRVSTASAASSRIPEAIPYRSDDWAQRMAKVMAWPMVAMGFMAVLGGLVAGIIGRINFGDFFSPSGVPADLGRAEAAVQLTGAVLFLGMGLILSGITMALVNIIRHLRDSGRDVQAALGASPLQRSKPWTGVLTPWVMMMGLMAQIGAFVIGVVTAVTIGGVDPASIAEPGAASSSDIADIGFVRAVSTWLPGLRLTSLAVILLAVVLALVSIQQAIRFQGQRIEELAEPVPAV